MANNIVSNGKIGQNGHSIQYKKNIIDFDLIEVIEYDFGSGEMFQEDDDPVLSLVTKRGLIKSILGCCLAVFLFFGAYSSTFTLQSSLHVEGGLGTVSLSVLYAVSLLSYPWLPSLTIRVLGLKKTMAVCVTIGSLFVIANLYPTWTTILISCAVSGVAMSTLWTCIPAYLTRSTLLYCRISERKTNLTNYKDRNHAKETEERATSKVFTFFYFCFQCSMLLGHITAYLILNPKDGNEVRDDNRTFYNTVSLYCGANFCDSNGFNIEKPEEWKVFSLCFLYISCFIGSFIAIVVIMEPIYYQEKASHNSQEISKNSNLLKQFLKFASKEVIFSLKSTWRFMRSKNLIPLAIITLYQGLESAFVSGEFTKAFVSCVCGVDCINYVLICYSVTYIIGSIIWSWLFKLTGRAFIILSAFALVILNIFLLLYWEPEFQDPPMTLFIMSAVFSLADCALQPQIMALYSLTFRDKEADVFATVGCADCLGGLLGFALSTLFCLRTKIYILIILWGFAVIGYIALEIRIHISKNKSKI